jgi:hypothetical protein
MLFAGTLAVAMDPDPHLPKASYDEELDVWMTADGHALVSLTGAMSTRTSTKAMKDPADEDRDPAADQPTRADRDRPLEALSCSIPKTTGQKDREQPLL